MIKAVLFDFDGVIHNTFDFHRNKVQEYTGIELSEDEYRDMHNGNFYSHTLDKLRDTNWTGYRDFIYQEHSRLGIDGEMREALLMLEKKHWLFIVSSGAEKNIMDYLKNNNIADLFKNVLGGDTHLSKTYKFRKILDEYSLDSRDCIFVTDTLGDILEANASDIKTIAVDFGYHNKETLGKGNPYKIASTIGELLAAIEEL